LRHKFAKLRLPISVTDVEPGFVDTAMAQADHKFLVASAEKAAKQIFEAIRKRKKQRVLHQALALHCLHNVSPSAL
jgi:short-subunit dehydrogenase